MTLPNEKNDKSLNHKLLNDSSTAENITLFDQSNIKEKQEMKYIEDWGSTDKDTYINANFISKIFFYWAFRLVRLSNLIKLKPEYIGLPEKDNKSNVYLEDLKDIWDRKQYKKRKSKALCCTVIRNNLFSLIFMIFLSILNVSIEFFPVVLFRMYIVTFDDDDSKKSKYPGYQIAIVFFLCKILVEIFKRFANQYQNIVGFKSSFELNCFIYEKTLKASMASRESKLDEGQIVNLLQVDSQKLNFAILLCPAIFTAPLQLIAYVYLLFQYFDLSAVFGLSVLFSFLIINYFMYRQYQKFFRVKPKMRDNRMNASSEVFNHLKLLKLYLRV